MNILFVVAHPDDEALGGGATIAKLTEEGHTVDVCVMNTFDVTAYDDAEKHRQLLCESDAMLGVRITYLGDYADSCMNSANHREMVQFIENAMRKSKPSIIFTHHPADVNEDHRWVFQSVMEAFRLGQRGLSDFPPVDQLLLMEVPSSTDWGIDPTKTPFRPNTFVEVQDRHISKKVESMLAYTGVIRDTPHPRSLKALDSLLMIRGAQGGYRYAEAFECVFRRGLL